MGSYREKQLYGIQRVKGFQGQNKHLEWDLKRSGNKYSCFSIVVVFRMVPMGGMVTHFLVSAKCFWKVGRVKWGF